MGAMLLLALAACGVWEESWISEEDLDQDGDGYRFDEDCDDADDTSWPGAAEVCDDGVINDCSANLQASFSQCGYGPTLALDEAQLALQGEAEDDLAGASVAGVGDVDGDGLADFMVGSPRSPDVEPPGSAWLVLGQTATSLGDSARLSETDLELAGGAAGDMAGRGLAGAGDVDGDGYDDLLVGAPGHDDGGEDAGGAWLVLASTALAAERLELSWADLTLIGGARGDGAGRAVAGVQDLDDDGSPELLIGAPGRDGEAQDDGVAWLVLGGTALAQGSLDLASSDLALVGEDAGDGAGTCVAGVGDVDADGAGDLLVGAPGADPENHAGRVHLVLGGGVSSGTSNLGDADLVIEMSEEASGLGNAVAGAGDVDDDGRDDLLVGAHLSYDGTGAAWVILGSSTVSAERIEVTEADLSIVGEAVGDYAGISVASAGDVDLDGRADLLVGAQGADTSAGLAWLVLGGTVSTSDGATIGTTALEIQGTLAGDLVGAATAGAGDVDGDGRADLLIGGYGVSSFAGAAWLVLGVGY